MTTEEKIAQRKKIGGMIAEIRKSKGISLRQLSDMCGVTFQNINKVENGRYNVSVDILAKICDALGCEFRITEKAEG